MKNKVAKVALLTILLTSTATHPSVWDDVRNAWNDIWNDKPISQEYNSAPEVTDEEYLNQLAEDLCPGYILRNNRNCAIPCEQISCILRIARARLNRLGHAEKTQERINQEMKSAVLDMHKQTTQHFVSRMSTNPQQSEAIVASESNNLRVELEKSAAVNGESLAPFFGQALIRRIENSISHMHNNQPPAPRITIQDYLFQLQHDLSGIPDDDISKLLQMVHKQVVTRNRINLEKLNQVTRAAIPAYVKEKTIRIARSYTDDTEMISRLADSMENNVIARIQRTKHLNGQALAQFFGAPLDETIFKELQYMQNNTARIPEKNLRPNPKITHFTRDFENAVTFLQTKVKTISKLREAALVAQKEFFAKINNPETTEREIESFYGDSLTDKILKNCDIACPVCYEYFAEEYVDGQAGKRVFVMPCAHAVCANCAQWCKTSNTCPVCRTPIDLNDLDRKI